MTAREPIRVPKDALRDQLVLASDEIIRLRAIIDKYRQFRLVAPPFTPTKLTRAEIAVLVESLPEGLLARLRRWWARVWA